MIRIGILGDIGSGKTFVAKRFGYPVFDADYEVSNLYNTNKILFNRTIISNIFARHASPMLSNF